jgi:hypothetical protein
MSGLIPAGAAWGNETMAAGMWFLRIPQSSPRLWILLWTGQIKKPKTDFKNPNEPESTTELGFTQRLGHVACLL